MSIQVGDILEGTVENITNYGAFIRLEDGGKGLVHISEVSHKYINNITEVLEEKQKVKVKVLSIDGPKVALSIKQAMPKTENKEKKQYNSFKNINNNEPKSFEDILSKFLKDSEERQLDVKKVFEAKRGYSSKRA